MSSRTQDKKPRTTGPRSGGRGDGDAAPRSGGGSGEAAPRRRSGSGGSASGGPAARKRLPYEERRVAILDSALEVFARHGYRGASIDDIAGAAGISKALIYEHFRSKRELHAALLERHVGELFERLAESAATSEPGDVRLRAGVDAFLAFVEARPDAFRMLFRDAVEPEVAQLLQGIAQQATLQVAELIATEPRERRADDAEEREGIEIFGAMLTGAVQQLAVWWDEHPRVPRELLVTRVMDFAWLGFERLRAGERFER